MLYIILTFTKKINKEDERKINILVYCTVQTITDDQ